MQVTVLIYYVYEGIVKTHEIPPTRETEAPNGRAALAHIGEHYEAVLMTDTFQRICENTITINDSPVKRGNKCSESGLLDLESRLSKRLRVDSDTSDSSSSTVSSGVPYSDCSSNESPIKSCQQGEYVAKK